MKPGRFDYLRPDDLQEALEALGHSGPETKLIAGGQSLLPLLNTRSIRPSRLVDVGRLDEIRGIRIDGRSLVIGAGTTQSASMCDPQVVARLPVLKEALGHVAHIQVRNRGTVGGSLVHGDPVAELITLAVALGATLRVRSSRGERLISAEDFFLSAFRTAIAPDEVLLESSWPLGVPGRATAYYEVARRHADVTLAGACAVLHSANGFLTSGRLVLLGAADVPVVVELDPWIGSPLGGSLVADIAAEASSRSERSSDQHASSRTRGLLLATAARKAVETAIEQLSPNTGVGEESR